MRRKHPSLYKCVCGRLRKKHHPVCGHCRKQGMTDAERAKLLDGLLKEQRAEQKRFPSVKVERAPVARELSRSVQAAKIYDPKG